jgi:hypothetical protein
MTIGYAGVMIFLKKITPGVCGEKSESDSTSWLGFRCIVSGRVLNNSLKWIIFKKRILHVWCRTAM